jgi:UDPglucose--hexose-1-phosphate uridylyltransferase
MSEYRRDPVTDRWVIIAPERAQRPREMTFDDDHRLESEYCPFCPGHESATPPSIADFPDGGDHWNVRIVPNKYPAVRASEDQPSTPSPLFERRAGHGTHEVVVESADHVVSLTDLEAEQLERVVGAWRHRLDALADDAQLEYALLFKNQGARAGATVEHAHSQLMALPMVPTFLQAELQGSRRYFNRHDRCVFCDLVEHNLDAGDRLVYANDQVVAFAPFASRFPFELWVTPRGHAAEFQAARSTTDAAVADALDAVLERLHQALDDPPYNMAVHTAPLRAGPLEHFHWHIEIIPALSSQAGFEWGSGWHINSTPPESAAAHLRKIATDTY